MTHNGGVCLPIKGPLPFQGKEMRQGILGFAL